MAPTSTFFTFLALVGIKVGKRKLRTWQNMVWKAFLLLSDLREFSHLALHMHQNGSSGYFFHFSCDCWNESLKKEA
jgi:hypothetical protein